MRNALLIVTIMMFQQSLFAQKEIVGKVEFYKSVESDFKMIESFPDVVIKNLTNRKYKLKIEGNTEIIKVETDSFGIFKFQNNSVGPVRISVNEGSPVFSSNFDIDLSNVKDTLKLRISDHRLAVYKDSLMAPEFHTKFSEKQAQLDFENGVRRIIGSGGFLSETTITKNKSLANKYDLKYEYLFGCMIDRTEIRIAYRYNQVMKKLIGIDEDTW